MNVGDLVIDCDGLLGVITEVQCADALYNELSKDFGAEGMMFDGFDKDPTVLMYSFVTVYSFQENLELVFFDSELEVVSRAKED